jgi:hypothetical protein
MRSRDRSLLLVLLVACTPAGDAPAGQTDEGVHDDDASDDAMTSGPTGATTSETSTDPSDSAETGSEPESDSDAPPTGPHALGVVVLGETHPATGGNAEPVVTAAFVPDAEAAAACVVEVAGCRVQQRPHCDDGCGDGEVCMLASDCSSACQPFCNAECEPTEECWFPSPGKSACRLRESFDAGVLSFVGTTTPITLFPPYSYGGDIGGAPFVPDQEITVTASGPSAAGFEPFERSFAAPPFVQTDIELLTLDDLFGAGPIATTWAPGSDDIEIGVSISGTNGTNGVATCEASDTDGAFAIPREVVDAVLDGDGPRAIALSITRRRTTTHYDLSTTGMLGDATVQDVGWLELRGESTETFSQEVERCGDCSYDADHDSCAEASFDCSQDSGCLQIYNCAALCNGWYGCIDDCVAMHPGGAAQWAELDACRCDACPLECAFECS